MKIQPNDTKTDRGEAVRLRWVWSRPGSSSVQLYSAPVVIAVNPSSPSRHSSFLSLLAKVPHPALPIPRAPL
ncbi:hypothetical protein IMZ48_27375 [Candidatus Bathyarchaeota archaeon]|nr:hypothetical protein [Candidatus Bathyarchaeota archaeon]